MALQHGLARYATGNAVVGGLSPVDLVSDELTRRVTAMIEKMPPEVAARFKIISGFRSDARQLQVNPSVKHSRHTEGTALDLQDDPVVLDWINRHPEHGVGFPLKNDPREANHLELLDARGLRLPPNTIPNKPVAISSVVAPPAPTTDSDLTAQPVPLATPRGEDPDLSGQIPATIDPRLLALMMQQQGNGIAGILGGPKSLADAVSGAVKASQPATASPEPILQPANVGAPIPLSRPLYQPIR